MEQQRLLDPPGIAAHEYLTTVARRGETTDAPVAPASGADDILVAQPAIGGRQSLERTEAQGTRVAIVVPQSLLHAKNA